MFHDRMRKVRKANDEKYNSDLPVSTVLESFYETTLANVELL